ncbi:MAG: 16S rRNA (cytosine(967)-C(5))-methyltransferase RsmB [Candidatus Aureabacteria bacterium]|nr:16S rRNA (cytosine(967)-C(5))-methyltransferase RsmB [Candidatus Auribacterota bacterium]
MTAREAAFRVLRGALRSDVFVSELLDREFRLSALPLEDRRLATELAYGCLRRRGTLDAVIERCAGRGMREITPGIDDILRLGVYQLLYLDRVPAYAAVDETVELAKRFGPKGSEKFVNAVLRRAQRSQREIAPLAGEGSPASSLAAAHSHPLWLVERWLARWGRVEVEALCVANNTAPPFTVRVNRVRISRDELMTRLARESARAVPHGGHPLALDIEELPCPLRDLASFREGLFQVQDVSGMRVVDLLGPRARERIADLCAGPGGKATGIAEAMGDEGEVICVELRGRKAGMISENAKRLGLNCITVVIGDALRAGTSIDTQPVDRVLVDAPCSNTGVLRRRPEARWRVSENDIGRLAGRQVALLTAGAAVVRRGGILVYSTCSIEPEENEKVVERFLQEFPAFGIEDQISLYPHRSGCDGGYAARLVRNR